MDNMQRLIQALSQSSDDDLAQMSHADLYRARGYASPELQNRIAPFEHRAFAREVTRDNPLMALPVSLAIPAYSAYKALGLSNARSAPSMQEMKQGLLGIADGLMRKN